MNDSMETSALGIITETMHSKAKDTLYAVLLGAVSNDQGK